MWLMTLAQTNNSLDETRPAPRVGVQVITTTGDVAPHFRDWAADLVADVFRRFASRIEHIVVRVADINGPRGGLDKRASVTVMGRDGHVTRVGGQAASYEAALISVARRAKRVVQESPRMGARRPRALRRWVRR